MPVVVTNNKLLPEQECAFRRDPGMGYETDGSFGLIRCLAHGAPNPLIRWHFHDEYELHLILETSGRVFVGDYIGQFQPGHLVLTGPRLPHNWVSMDLPAEGVAVRDLAIQFGDAPLRKAMEQLPELKEILPLLERARHGVEFRGISEQVREQMTRIMQSRGLTRLIGFCQLMQHLTHHEDYRLLSAIPLQTSEEDGSIHRISEVVDYISRASEARLALADVAARFGMSESTFSRYFRRMTGNTFTNFLNQLRVNKACQMLLETDQYVSTICYNVGFNNVANFNRRFMEIKGMTPSDFRRVGKDRFQSQVAIVNG